MINLFEFQARGNGIYIVSLYQDRGLGSNWLYIKHKYNHIHIVHIHHMYGTQSVHLHGSCMCANEWLCLYHKSMSIYREH